MIDQNLADYINKARQIGVSDDHIKTELIKAGWQETQVSEALSPAPQTLEQMERPSRILMIAVIAGVVLFIGAGSVVAMKYFSKQNVEEKTVVPVAELPTNDPINNGPADAAPTVTPEPAPTASDSISSTNTNEAFTGAPSASYHNSVQKYRIEYPDGYVVIDSSKAPNLQSNIMILDQNNPDGVMLSIYQDPLQEKYHTLSEYADYKRNIWEKKKVSKNISYQETTLSVGKQNIQGIQFYSDNDSVAGQTWVNADTYFEYSNHVYWAVLAYPKYPGSSKYTELYNSILKSISFD